MAFSMTDDELKTRIKNGTPIKILAELNGCSDQTIYNWMKKNGVERQTHEPEKKAPVQLKSQLVAKVVAVEPKIEVTESVFRLIKLNIRECENQIENFKKAIAHREEEIDSWKKILAVCKQKEALKND